MAFVRHQGPTTVIYVQHLTQAELTAGGMNFCVTPNTRVANGTMGRRPPLPKRSRISGERLESGIPSMATGAALEEVRRGSGQSPGGE